MHRRIIVVQIDDSSDSDSDSYSDSDRESCSDSADSSHEPPKIKYSGPDEYLSEMIKFYALDSSPGVGWDDIAGLHEAKRLLKEVVVLPRLIPEYLRESGDLGEVLCYMALREQGKPLWQKLLPLKVALNFSMSPLLLSLPSGMEKAELVTAPALRSAGQVWVTVLRAAI
ncbi:hypothetical protein OROMI_004886 [Orobanche minor]